MLFLIHRGICENRLSDLYLVSKNKFQAHKEKLAIEGKRKSDFYTG